MNGWIFPLTLFLLGCLVYLFALVFLSKKLYPATGVAGGVLILISIVMLFQRGHVTFAGILLCFITFFLILHFGFDISWGESKATGPYKEFLGKEGTAFTSLDPKGKICVTGEYLDAATEGLFIAGGSKIKVIRCASKMVIVEKIEE